MKVTAILAFLFLVYDANAQTFSLDEILNIRTMDSTELRTFASGRGFELKEIENDSYRSVHRYYSSDSTIWFSRTFPTGRELFSENKTTKDHSMVYYHFTDKKSLKEFKAKMKDNGFKFKQTNQNNYGGNLFTHSIYLTQDTEIDLASEKTIGQNIRYTLIYYSRMN